MIYAVEDDRNIRELIVYALRQSGFEAEGFEDGSRLMELPAPELVILDIMLPGEDGLSILRRLRADPVRKRVPVILLTALSGEENRVDGFEAGADGYITTVSYTHLMGCIARWANLPCPWCSPSFRWVRASYWPMCWPPFLASAWWAFGGRCPSAGFWPMSRAFAPCAW